MNHLFIDCETSGKADFNAPFDAPHQPHIVQLAAILMNQDAKEIMSINVIIRPEGWTIPDEAAKIHGITTEYATEVGVHIEDVLWVFSGMKKSAETYVAHNIEFDKMMIAIEVTRQKGKMTWSEESMPPEKCFCTMKAMTDICQLPGPYGFKWPKLIEAHRHAFGCDFDGAHDALADVRSCAKLFFWLRNTPPEDQPVFLP